MSWLIDQPVPSLTVKVLGKLLVATEVFMYLLDHHHGNGRGNTWKSWGGGLTKERLVYNFCCCTPLLHNSNALWPWLSESLMYCSNALPLWLNIQAWRSWGIGGGCQTDFGTSVNPISTRGTCYAQDITIGSPTDFQTFLRPCGHHYKHDSTVHGCKWKIWKNNLIICQK